MSEVEPVALVIGIPLIPAACVWFNRKHTYERYNALIGRGNCIFKNYICEMLTCLIAIFIKVMVLIMWFPLPKNQ